ncbi:MAG: glycosyltransferase family 2 protein [Arenicellales bacterium]
MTQPMVSIGMPVWNGERFLQKAIDSLLGQTFTDFELLISDNASTDATPEIVRGALQRDPRVRYDRLDENIGASPNYNRVLRRTRGRYFTWAACDDVYLPRWLEETFRALTENPGAVLAHTRTRFIDEHDRTIKEEKPGRRHTAGSISPVERLYDIAYVRHACLQLYGLIPRQAAERTGGFQSITAADRVVLVKLALMGRFIKLPEVLFLSRRHPGMSRQLVKRPHAYAVWADPTNASRLQRSTWRLYLEYWRSVAGAPLRSRERLGCAVVLARWPWTHHRWKTMALEIVVPRRAAGL